MEISAAIVKKLRDATGAGMMDCKKALVQAEGDFAKAERILKEMGLAAMAKRADRATENGRVFTLVKDDKAVILEMSSETDFVARNQDFINLGNELCEDVIVGNHTEVTDAMQEKVNNLISTIKENMALKRFKALDIGDNEYVSQYIHGEGTLGVIVKIKADNKEVLASEKVQEFANDCALHVAAFNPQYFSKDSVDPTYLNEQKEIFTTQTLALDKPEKVVAGIVQGKLNKHLSEICFLQQPFVKDDSKSVEQTLAALAKEVDSPLSIETYVLYRVGVEQ
ncbi:MAG: translation elongation factor Ts [Sphaerochaetaceae bacterium]